MGWGEKEDKSTFVWGKKLEKQGLKDLSKKGKFFFLAILQVF
jgi:hypothetical protein